MISKLKIIFKLLFSNAYIVICSKERLDYNDIDGVFLEIKSPEKVTFYMHNINLRGK